MHLLTLLTESSLLPPTQNVRMRAMEKGPLRGLLHPILVISIPVLAAESEYCEENRRAAFPWSVVRERSPMSGPRQ
jgi:hypothetical protein